MQKKNNSEKSEKKNWVKNFKSETSKHSSNNNFPRLSMGARARSARLILYLTNAYRDWAVLDLMLKKQVFSGCNIFVGVGLVQELWKFYF